MQVEPRSYRIIDRAKQLPIEMRPHTKSAKVAISRGGKPVSKVILIAPYNQRVGPREAVRYRYRGQSLPQLIQGDVAVQPPHAKAQADIGFLVRQCQRPVQENRAAGIYREI